MSEAWKHLDLQGGGLQTLNLLMTRHQRRRGRAYLLWLGFPLGLHRFYLRSPLAWLYPGLSLAAGIAATGPGPAWAVALTLPLAGFAIYDLITLEAQVNAFNKALRMRLYLGQGATPPPGYRGRYGEEEHILEDYLEEKEQERPGHQAPTAPGNTTVEGKKVFSFAEQEALLREMQQQRPKPRKAQPRN